MRARKPRPRWAILGLIQRQMSGSDERVGMERMGASRWIVIGAPLSMNRDRMDKDGYESEGGPLPRYVLCQSPRS